MPDSGGDLREDLKLPDGDLGQQVVVYINKYFVPMATNNQFSSSISTDPH